MKKLILAASLLSTTAPAIAAPLLLEGHGMTFEVRTDLPGGDSFPFTGLVPEVDVPFSFHVLFDSDTAATSNDGVTAVYDFAGTGSWMLIDENLFEPTSLIVTTSTTDTSSWVNFSLRNDDLGVSAGLFFSSNQPGLLGLPTSLDQYFPGGQMGANSDQNMFLIPILAGMVTQAAITPAPASLGLLGLGLLATARRRR